jgi:hypothetical protein
LPIKELDLGGDLSYSEKLVRILDMVERVTHNKVIKMCKVQWSPRRWLAGEAAELRHRRGRGDGCGQLARGWPDEEETAAQLRFPCLDSSSGSVLPDGE